MAPLTSGSDPTDMAFLTLVNKRLDHLKAYCSESHCRETFYLAKRWIKRWGEDFCSEITRDDIEVYVFERRRVSHYTANKEIRYLRTLFNFGIKNEWLDANPTKGIEFLPVEKKLKYVPPQEDNDKIIEVADPDVKDYLWTIRDTMGRMSEINRLTWVEVDFAVRRVTLYTRKKRGGHLTPRGVPMAERLYNILVKRYQTRDPEIPWVFWHTFTSSKTGEKVKGPFQERKKIMRTLCKKAGVRYFQYHALRHSGASVMDNSNVPIGSIQRILGHENRSTAEIYLHGISNSERDAISIFEEASKKSLSKSLSGTKKGSDENRLNP